MAEGTDDAGAAHALIEVAVDGAPESAANLVELVVSREVGRHNLAAQEDEYAASNQGLPEANDEHKTDHNNNMGKHAADVLQWVK